MKSKFLALFTVWMLLFSQSFADKVIWKDTVSANGTPSTAVNLTLKRQYKIKASGEINLGKWWQGKTKLASDPCYEYNGPQGPELSISLENSSKISVCNGFFHENHVYESAPFIATQSKIHFWVTDDDYDDNTGEFHVEVIEISNWK